MAPQDKDINKSSGASQGVSRLNNMLMQMRKVGVAAAPGPYIYPNVYDSDASGDVFIVHQSANKPLGKPSCSLFCVLLSRSPTTRTW